MKGFLKNHPFSIEAYFKSSTVLTYAVPKEHLKKLIPECLTIDTFNDNWGFIAMAMVQTKKLRPKGFPEFMGNNFFLVGFRIFVRYKTSTGKNLRGLYIIKSETDKKRMQFLGNIFTHYNYTTIDIERTVTKKNTNIRSQKSNFEVAFEQPSNEVNLPEDSPFTNWKEARRFAGPLPFTFTFNKTKRQVLIIEGVRSDWKPTPLKIQKQSVEFIKSLHLKNVVLASAFQVENIPYYWKKGKTDLWIP